MLRDETAEPIRPVPQRRIVEKMDEYMSRRDYAGSAICSTGLRRRSWDGTCRGS